MTASWAGVSVGLCVVLAVSAVLFAVVTAFAARHGLFSQAGGHQDTVVILTLYLVVWAMPTSIALLAWLLFR